jgi:hypothetical protein
MFENLGLKDEKEARAKWLETCEKMREKHAREKSEMERKHSEAISRLEIRNEELKAAVKAARSAAEDTISRELWDKMRQEHRETIARWEQAMREQERRQKQLESKMVSVQMPSRNMPLR